MRRKLSSLLVVPLLACCVMTLGLIYASAKSQTGWSGATGGVSSWGPAANIPANCPSGYQYFSTDTLLLSVCYPQGVWNVVGNAGIGSFHAFGTSGPACNGAGTNNLPFSGTVNSCVLSTSVVQNQAPGAGTVVVLEVLFTAAPGAGNSVAVTIVKNGTPTAVTCTIAGASATTCSDTTHTFTYAAADLLYITAVASVGQTSAVIKWSIKINGS
jgi:hypothetical protein